MNSPVRTPPIWFVRHGAKLLLALFATSVMWFVLIETPFGAGLSETIRFTALPLAIVIVVFTAAYWRWLLQARAGRPWKVLLVSILIFLALTLMSWPQVLALNAAFPAGSRISNGKIINKTEMQSSARGYANYRWEFEDSTNRRRMVVSVSKRRFDSSEKGDLVRCRFMRGAFDIDYRWRFSNRRPACWILRD